MVIIQSDGGIVALSSGVTAEEGDGITCEIVEEIGACIQAKMDKKGFLDTVMKRSDQVKTLMRLQKGLRIDGKEVFMDNMQLFNRLIVLVERTSKVEKYFRYELTPVPASFQRFIYSRLLVAGCR